MNESLKQSLEFAKISKLPPEWNGKFRFQRAIALVQKSSLRQDYVIVENEHDFREIKFKVVADFCPTHGFIVKYLAVYPYEYFADIDAVMEKLKNKSSCTDYLNKRFGYPIEELIPYTYIELYEYIKSLIRNEKKEFLKDLKGKRSYTDSE